MVSTYSIDAMYHFMKSNSFWTILSLATVFHTSAFAQMDLHAHVDMKPGMGPLLRGSFDQAPKSHKWNSRLSTKASALSLEQFDAPSIIVVSFYSHPVLSFFSDRSHGGPSIEDLPGFDDEENLRRALDLEYAHVKQFVKTHSNRFMIARNAKEAQSALEQKKAAILLSIEGSSGILETENDFKKWIDVRGVSIVTPFHMTEDHFGGVAMMRGLPALTNTPIEFLRSLWLTGGKCLQTYCKDYVGIKGDGRVLIDRLFERKVWIDFSHANDVEAQDLVMDHEKRNLPLLVTHTQLRSHLWAERGLGEVESDYIKKHDGIIGLIPTNDMMTDLKNSDSECQSGLDHFKKIVAEATKEFGTEKISLGSDVNAPMKGLSPRCASKKPTTELERDGYYQYGQWIKLGHFVSPSVDWAAKSRQHFLDLWKKVRP